MRESLQAKLQTLVERYEELGVLLGDPDIIGDQKKFRGLSKEYAQLEDLVTQYRRYVSLQQDILAAEGMLQEADVEIQQLAKEELTHARENLQIVEQTLQVLLLPKDPNDTCDAFIEIRAGTGGDEAAIFCGDLCRMYTRYAEQQSWRVQSVSANDGEHGGYKEVVLQVSGEDVFAKLKFESGAHRVQRVPETESQGRIHTSACTVAILPVVEAIEGVSINPADLKIDTYRSSGAGGQHVNTTDSAIRITHLPTGIVVECQDERSQHKNRAKAMSLLQSKILAGQQAQQAAEIATMRRNLVGSGDRSERIRTYNYPQGRVTDHRINLTLYKLSDVMEGALAQVIEPLVREHQADLLASFDEA